MKFHFSLVTHSLTRTHTGRQTRWMQSLMREQKRARGLRCALLKGSSDYRCCETQPFPRVRLRIPPLTHRRALTSVDTVCVGMMLTSTPLHMQCACVLVLHKVRKGGPPRKHLCRRRRQTRMLETLELVPTDAQRCSWEGGRRRTAWTCAWVAWW